MNEQKNSESRTFKVLMTIMIMIWIIMITTLLHFYLFLCFEWAQYKWNIITSFIPSEEFDESRITKNQISWIYEYNRTQYNDDGSKIRLINFVLSWTEYDWERYHIEWYLDNVVTLAVNDYYIFEDFPKDFWKDFLYDFKFSRKHLIHCTVLDKKTWKVLWDPNEKSWIELHDMISE